MRKMVLAAPLLAVLLVACDGNGGDEEATPTEAQPTATQAESVERPTATEDAATEEAPSVDIPSEIVEVINADIAAGNTDGIDPGLQLVPNECGEPEVQPGDLCVQSESTTVSETEATIALSISGSDSRWEIDLVKRADGEWWISGVLSYQ